MDAINSTEIKLVVDHWTDVPSNFTGLVARLNPCLDYGIAHFKNGQFHCEIGPAILYSNGEMLWFLDGNKLEFEDFFDLQKDSWSEERLNHIIFNLDLFRKSSL